MSAPGPARAVAARAGRWVVADPGARAGFVVRKLGVIRVRGSFAVAAGEAVLDGDGVPVAASATLDAASFATGNPRRDRDVVGRRFLDADAFRQLRFVAERIEPAPDGAWLVRGHLAVRDRRAPLDLTVTREPATAAGEAVTITARGVLDRHATGIRAPRALIGRWLGIEVTAVLTRAPVAPPPA